MFEKSDQELINKALNGNKKAWIRLLKRHEQAVYHYGIRMTGNSEDALDLMQEVFISVFRNLAGYRGEGSFKSWLFRIAHYRCIEFYRRKRPMVALDDVPEIRSEAVEPEERFHSKEANQQLLNAMQHLSLKQRAVVELKFFGQFTFEEIGEQLGVSANTVKSRLYSALDKLKDLVEVEYA